MNSETSSEFTGKSLTAIAILLCWFSTCTTLAAQGTQGQNAVCSSVTGCSTQAGSSAFIDAKMYLGSSNGIDFCDTLNGILGSRFGNTYPSSGSVIDARGISGSALNCAASPWGSGSGYQNKPSTILLPSGIINSDDLGLAQWHHARGTGNH
jgi:hypothetical protein